MVFKALLHMVRMINNTSVYNCFQNFSLYWFNQHKIHIFLTSLNVKIFIFLLVLNAEIPVLFKIRIRKARVKYSFCWHITFKKQTVMRPHWRKLVTYFISWRRSLTRECFVGFKVILFFFIALLLLIFLHRISWIHFDQIYSSMYV